MPFRFVIAQLQFRTVIPNHAIIAGESFQVQFIIEDGGRVDNFTPPQLKGFRFVAGPNTYTGSAVESGRIKQFTNLVYTLAARKKGKFIIPGGTATINGKYIRSNDIFVQVISRKEAISRSKKAEVALNGNSEYFLRPGEDPWEKIRRNLFLKISVDHCSCYVGEPLVATFKLYSRLESRSDIVKNPGFYGFGVHDMISLDDKISTTENINGHSFDVHTIRKVQLYPLQPGTFTIDAMELENKVEFSRSVINKRTEQEIVEGMYGKTNEEVPHANTETFETSMRTDPVLINVKPLPANNKIENFNGAVGDFKMEAILDKDKLKKNEEGTLIIKIYGKGNFTQLGPPAITWPPGLEVFEPSTKEILDRSKVPLEGIKTFRYSFLSSRPGLYIIRPVPFSFFHVRKKDYTTITSQPLQLTITHKPENKSKAKINIMGSRKRLPSWLIPAGFFSLIILSVGWYLNRKKQIQLSAEKEKQVPLEADISIEEMLLPLTGLINSDNKSYCRELNYFFWKYFNRKLQISGSEMNKVFLAEKLRTAGVEISLIDELISLLQQCETGIYTDANSMADKEIFLEQAKHLLLKLDESLNRNF